MDARASRARRPELAMLAKAGCATAELLPSATCETTPALGQGPK